MIKKTIVLLLLSIPLWGNAQSIEDWQVGINLNPFYFDWNSNDQGLTDVHQNIPNGLAFGLTVEKNWNTHWGIKTGVEYSKQNKKYDDAQYSGNVYLADINMDFKYYKIPLTIQYSHPINKNRYLTFNQGIQFSFLNDYKTTIDDALQSTIFTPNQRVFISKINANDSNNTNPGWIYKKNTFGIIGSVGIKGFLTKKISFSTNLRYEYDLTYSDLDEYYILNKNKANNFRLGLELGLQYHFSLKGCGFCALQKH